MRLSLSRPAQADLDGIWSYIESQSGNPQIEDRVMGSITEIFRLLRRNPNLGRRRDERSQAGYPQLSGREVHRLLPHSRGFRAGYSRASRQPRHPPLSSAKDSCSTIASASARCSSSAAMPRSSSSSVTMSGGKYVGKPGRGKYLRREAHAGAWK